MDSATSFEQLFREHAGKVSDKWTLYLAEYDALFNQWRDRPVRLLEIGTQNGGSLEICAKYFKNAERLVGCDIEPKCAGLRYDDPRISVVVGDANSDACEKEIEKLCPSYDIIIDDGSHKSGDIVRSFARYFDRLGNNGIYVVEDLHASYWADWEGGLHNPYSAMAYFKRLADVLNHEHWRQDRPRAQHLEEYTKRLGVNFGEHTLSSIHSITFANSLCVIRKCAPDANVVGPRIVAGTQASVWPGVLKRSGTTVFDIRADITADDHLDIFRLREEAEEARHRLALERESLASERLAKEEAERKLATERERLANERRAREEAEHQLATERERLTNERQAKEETEHQLVAERERLANERRAKEETERLLVIERERLANERRAKEETEHQLAAERERLANERQAKEETEHQLAAERERLANERRAKEETERQLAAEREGLGDLERKARSSRWLFRQVWGKIIHAPRDISRRLRQSRRKRRGQHSASSNLFNKRYRKFASSRVILRFEASLPARFAERMHRRMIKNAPLGTRAVEASVEAGASDRQQSRGSHYPFSRPRNALRVIVVAWDVGHNPVGRASLLAEALSRHFDVTLLGPQFPRYGSVVWEPLRDSSVPIITFPGADYPDFACKLSDIASRLDCDVIVACKPRLPSLHLGLLAKHAHDCPLIIDVDDYEPSFCKTKNLPTDLITIAKHVKKDELRTPYSDTWTLFAETLIQYADGVLVSNEALQRKFGGVIIPHARDETIFNPNLYDRESCRKDLGIAQSEKMILFAGTVREHKGLLELADVVHSLKRDDVKLCILGDIPDRKLEMRIREKAGNTLLLIPKQPLQKLPKYLMAADLVCLLQREDSEIARYQLPAKVIDALAMGVPILATKTPPLRNLVKIGAVVPITLASLPEKLSYALEHHERLREEQLARRPYFESTYSYEAIAREMKAIILKKVGGHQDLNPSALNFEGILRVSHERKARHYTREGQVAKIPTGIDVVFFWKQFDAGVYGRRVDMLAKYLSRHKDIRRVLFVDPPLVGAKFLELGRHRQNITEHRLVYNEIVSRRLGLRDSSKLKFHTFLYGTLEEKNLYLESIRNFFNKLGIDPSQAVFWLFPVNEWLPKIVRHFEPRLVISDIVDDNRQQPGLKGRDINERDANYREILGMSDLAITNVPNLMNAMQEYTDNIKLLPNAFELEQPVNSREHALERLLAIPSPRLGYVGNLESKIDTKLLEFIAKARPEWHIILVGSTHARPEILELNRFSNVHFMGVLKYEAARVWMKHFDIAIIPHLDTPLTRSMNPLKAYVYIAAGVPVVATDIMNLPDLDGLISVATSHEDFLQKTEFALQHPKRGSAQNREMLTANTWEARAEQATVWIRELLRTKQSARWTRGASVSEPRAIRK